MAWTAFREMYWKNWVGMTNFMKNALIVNKPFSELSESFVFWGIVEATHGILKKFSEREVPFSE